MGDKDEGLQKKYEGKNVDLPDENFCSSGDAVINRVDKISDQVIRNQLDLDDDEPTP